MTETKEKDTPGGSQSGSGVSNDQDMAVTIEHNGDEKGDTKEEKKDTSFKYYLVCIACIALATAVRAY